MEPVDFVVASLVFLGALVVTLSVIFKETGLSEEEHPSSAASPSQERESHKVA